MNKMSIHHSTTNPQLSLWQCFLKVMGNYACITGRSSRREYWGFILFSSLPIAFVNYNIWWLVDLQKIAASQLTNQLEKIASSPRIRAYWINLSDDQILYCQVDYRPFYLLAFIFIHFLFLLPHIGVLSRRLHDIGKSAVPAIVGLPLIFVMLCLYALELIKPLTAIDLYFGGFYMSFTIYILVVACHKSVQNSIGA